MEYIQINNNIDIENLDPSLFEHFGDNVSETEHIYTKQYSYWKTVFKKVIKSWTFMICLIILLIFIICACSIAIGKPAVGSDVVIGSGVEGPSSEHWFGTGKYGEDLWNKIWIGSRTTLLFALIVFTIQVFVGVLVGSIWGFYKRVDILFLEIVRFLTMIPSLVLWLVVIFLFKKPNEGPSIGVVVLAISITSWIVLASLIRIQIILTRNMEYNIASKVLGSKGPRIIRKNIMPRILPIVIQTCAFIFPEAIAIDSTLSYLGFGFVTDIESASLGSILNEVLSNSQWIVTPHLLIIPICFVGGISLVMYLMGKILSDSLDPKTHK